MALVGVVAIQSPVTANTGGYPHSNAYGYDVSDYDWRVDENGDGDYTDGSPLYEWYSERMYWYRNCTDYVAWKLESLGVPGSKARGLGNGGQWADRAHLNGLNWGSSPAAGAAAVRPTTSSDPYGHVAYVEAVYSDGTIKVSEYNKGGDGNYSEWTGAPSARGFAKFVYFAGYMTNLPSGGYPADGTVVEYQGNKYVIAGGAPIYISDWSAIGGVKPYTSLSSTQWNSLLSYPKDGTFIRAKKDSGTGTNAFVIAGGAPIYVSDWAAVGGQPSTVTMVDVWSVNHPNDSRAHLRGYPADGAYIKALNSSGTGTNSFVVVGGAPIYVSDWAAVDGQPSTVTMVDAWSINHPEDSRSHLRAYPKNGVFVKALNESGTGTNSFVIAGGAPIYVSDWAAVGGQPSTVTMVDAWSVNNTANTLAHLRAAPADGTELRSGSTGQQYVVTAGMPNAVSTASAPVTVDQYSIDHALQNSSWPRVN